MDSTRFLTGQFLLAMPGIGDPRFERAVIAVCAHDVEGALGIGIGALSLLISGIIFVRAWRRNRRLEAEASRRAPPRQLIGRRI